MFFKLIWHFWVSQKKKRKKSKKKKDGNTSLDQNQSLPDVSHTSIGNNQGKRTQGGRDSSDSENSDNAMDETSDSLQGDLSSLESQTSSLVANSPAAACEDTQVTQSEKTAAREEESTAKQSDDDPSKSNEGESKAQKTSQDEMINTAPADTPPQHSAPEDTKTTPQSGLDKEPKANDPKNLKTDIKKSNKKATVTTTQPTLDQNANMEPKDKQTGQTKQKGKSQQDQKQKNEQKIFGTQTSSKVMLIL